ncbi:MAG: 16S rRNA processing protein RimM [Acidobacteria bacterium RIFCSPLOWO2_12_FULL_54_10]|nr:MAG: 16S rRNA processing protein RimM [Acidobacteria bacterium RIFCSPLOWO2_12_FULL_54_10]
MLLTLPTETAFVAIARIRRPRGRRGELAAVSLTDYPDRFQPELRVRLSKPGFRKELVLQESWFHGEILVLKFHGVDSISDAEPYAGCLVELPLSERRRPSEGAVYIDDLIGCAVLQGSQLLGTITATENTGGVLLLKVNAEQGELLIPFAKDICTSVDMEKREIRVDLPVGLLELNVNKKKQSTSAPAGRRRGKSDDD